MRLTTRTLNNGLDVTRAYRDDTLSDQRDNLLASITVETAPGLADRPGLSLTYTYDANGNMTAEDMGGVMDPYGTNLVQDAKDRMTAWTRDTTATSLDAQTWNLSFENDWDSTTTTDSSTNTTQSRTHNTAHELLTIDPTPASPNSGDELAQSYDPKGNLSNDAQGRAFTHDFDNMLSSVTISPSATRGTPGTHSYTYDALGRRVSKTTNGTTTVFVCSNGQVLAEYTAGNTAASPDRKYVYGDYIDEPIALIDSTGPTEETYYYHRNRQYSIIALTTETGQVVERYAYTAYGDPTVFAADGVTLLTTSGVGNTYLHTGRRYDDETALYYYRARYYSPTLGQFLQRDPLGYPDGLNTYAAYHVMHSGLDPMGLQQAVPVTSGAPAPYTGPNPIGRIGPATATGVAATGTAVVAAPGAVATGGAVILTAGAGLAVGYGIYYVGDTIYQESGLESYLTQQQGDLTHVAGSVVIGNDDLPMPLTYPGAQTISPPGKCTDKHYQRLRNKKENWCNKKRSCKKVTDCDKLKELIENNKRCFWSRNKIMGLCFDGGDFKHRREANNVLRDWRSCVQKFNKLCGGQDDTTNQASLVTADSYPSSKPCH